MKVIIGADTHDFDKGAKAVKQGLKDLDKTGTQAMTALGDAFGVNTGKVGQMTSALTGLGQKLSQCGSTGVAAFGSVLKSIGAAGGAIAGLGITAAIAGFKQLKAEADNFKSTIDGMNMSMATAAYISTYKQALHDVNSDTGKAVAEAMSNWEKGFSRFKANLGAVFTTSVGQDQKWYDAFLPTGIIRGWRTVREGIDEATAAAERNEARGSQLADIMKEELQVRREVADIEVQIAEQRRILRDRSADAADRTAAEAEVRRLITERTEKQTSIAQRLYETTQAMTDETGSTYEEVAKCVSLYEQWQGRIAATENEMAGVDRYANSIASGTSKAAEAAAKLREEMRLMAETKSKWAGLGTVSTDGLSSFQSGVQGPEMSILLHPKVDKKEAIDISGELASLVEQGALSASEAIGNLIGDLATGGDAWTNFANNALSAFGDMAIAVGKMAIGTGVATLGIKKALESMNGYVAIAAGAALVALGTAVKSGLSNIASGDYSSGGGGYSGSYAGGSGSSGYETRDVKVYVTGTLEADGDKLITVIKNANNKAHYTG
ncbi:MAG: hypothetical protein J6P62_11845 [Bacteroidales bacterium]|nr:hypothetical protein [Bacteroidales bacterium]